MTIFSCSPLLNKQEAILMYDDHRFTLKEVLELGLFLDWEVEDMDLEDGITCK